MGCLARPQEDRGLVMVIAANIWTRKISGFGL
jgi:hypothetical protein